MKPEEMRKLSFATLCVHGSGGVDRLTGAVSIPIYQSSTFAFPSARAGAEIFAGQREGYIYTRIGNPTVDAFEREMAFLEGGEAACATASGMAATTTAVLTAVRTGENIVASDTLYGGTHQLFRETMKRLGIEVRDVEASQLANIEAAMDENTRVVFIETPSNPTLKLIDIAGAAAIAHRHGALLMVDNTFATPYFQRPLSLGADIVIHSATKYIGGHGDTIGGVIVGPADFIKQAKGQVLRDLGGCLSPFNAWLFVRGLKTLPVRMERHQFNAMRIAHYLSFHPKVARVWYPGLRIHPQHELARKQMTGFGGMVSFELKGGRAAGEKLMDSVKLMTLAVSLGDCDTLIEHPASMTHSTYSEEELLACGITPGLVRLSVGIEAVEDLINDLSQALRKIK
ncbi:MAG: aminotransferase class I/II-fold pyridoxal phosphate-dependent enzyme [candidate division KSB1 bacterium]|nr:aminotransferase class I/II-fold pyridoxal phosphate-dependent enzyme [candidate division KSB1 bacterium]MDZ7338404.1 aminotransferase class I/II-fold pyridoxal phosphate-dependent enzyme [candidate division KSB1 bacterium]MDZ7385085.1 aminotransferase class I/II-fold pyridoxal phosphate-dependent enzyme [candidate division KSB1 bacterium]MDZ7391656.1 aminotransferase class I/II-fold pyridoxal phosphate-dependent enzyme [candidate division KSB1 bacterium]MDZ7413410.1 aminotransferase class I